MRLHPTISHKNLIKKKIEVSLNTEVNLLLTSACCANPFPTAAMVRQCPQTVCKHQSCQPERLQAGGPAGRPSPGGTLHWWKLAPRTSRCPDSCSQGGSRFTDTQRSPKRKENVIPVISCIYLEGEVLGPLSLLTNAHVFYRKHHHLPQDIFSQ